MVRKDRGFTLAFSAMIALSLAVGILAVSALFKQNTHQQVYLSSIDTAYKNAEIGLYQAIDGISHSSDQAAIDAINAAQVNVPLDVNDKSRGTYTNFVQVRQNPSPNIFYIQSTGTKPMGGKDQTVTLHSYVEISNVGDYFAAIKDTLSLSRGADISQGRIYAPIIVFNDDGSGTTRVEDAQFTRSVTPPLNAGSTDWLDPATANSYIQVLSSAKNIPTKLNSELLFPQVFDSDLADWQIKAAQHADLTGNDCTFKNDIYPPGFVGNSYGDLDQDSTHHIYYCKGNINVEGVIHGQILFVTPRDIHITGNLTKFNSTDISTPDGSLPDGSKAHQAALITQGSIYVDTMAGITTPPALVQTETIQALLMAPNARLIPMDYYSVNPDIMSKLRLDFTGSMILSSISSSVPRNFPTVFGAYAATGNSAYVNHYAYDDSLKKYPLPYLPAIARIDYSLEQVKDTTGLVN